ncbi:MAG: hypothetical protein AB8G11_04575 [Saprospiraceae bacterium]
MPCEKIDYNAFSADNKKHFPLRSLEDLFQKSDNYIAIESIDYENETMEINVKFDGKLTAMKSNYFQLLTITL